MRAIFLVIHISSGSLALLTGPVAMMLPKRPGWHPRLGISYQVLIGLLCASAIGLAVLTPHLWWFAIIAVATWAAALAGWQVRRRHRPGWLPWHISFMCGSYISLTTALLVVNLGTGVPIAWILPAAIGSPLIAYKAYRVAVPSMVRPDRPPELADSPYEPVNGHLADAQPAGDL